MQADSIHAGRRAWLFALALLVVLGIPPLSAQDLAITDVTTIDPPSGAVRAGRTVLVDDGVIRSIGEGLPEGATPETVVDGSGRYLIPGLWDMHVHLSMHTETDLVMLVVNGVLNVRDMGAILSRSPIARTGSSRVSSSARTSGMPARFWRTGVG